MSSIWIIERRKMDSRQKWVPFQGAGMRPAYEEKESKQYAYDATRMSNNFEYRAVEYVRAAERLKGEQ